MPNMETLAQRSTSQPAVATHAIAEKLKRQRAVSTWRASVCRARGPGGGRGEAVASALGAALHGLTGAPEEGQAVLHDPGTAAQAQPSLHLLQAGLQRHHGTVAGQAGHLHIQVWQKGRLLASCFFLHPALPTPGASYLCSRCRERGRK